VIFYQNMPKLQDFLWTLNFCRFWPIMQIRKRGDEIKKNLLLWNYWANLNQTLHNRYISAERKISQKNPEYMLNYSLPCSCS
jgi:hypothetical protein